MKKGDEDALRQYGDGRGLFCPADSRDLDFGDVFGGPPRQRRFLMRGCGGGGGGAVVGETTVATADPEPVFGGKSAVRRQHHHGDHFFDDIFRGNELCSSAWRWRRTSSPYSSSSSAFSNEIKYEVHQSNRYHHFMGDDDFAKIFNNEKQTDDLNNKKQIGTQSCRWSSTAAGRKPKENDLQVMENLRKFEPEQWLHTKTQSCTSNNAYTNKKTEFSSESLRWDSKILGEDSDDPFEDLFELQELSDDLEQDTPGSQASDETKALDAKIKQWSIGKKGNIRSLLSTLQYVLWGGSQWQAIALVDLVEETDVKRAYQKALLRLHPDKLQQKGAGSHHKFIAQKVFDILQEAWDHFNNIATI